MSEFTKGKWEYDEPLGVIYSDETNKVIANVHGAGAGSCFCLAPEGQANARLIAAAPDMYELLQSLSYRTSGMEQHEVLKIRELLDRIDGKDDNHE